MSVVTDSPEALARLPAMRDAEWRSCMDVLLAMEPAAVFTHLSLHDLGGDALWPI